MAWLESALAAAAVIVADQTAKNFILARHYAAASTPRSFISIHRVINTRKASLPPAWRWLRILAFLLCAILSIIALTQEPLRNNLLGATGIGLAFGGIAGNFIDLMRRGGIVDFIAVGPLPVCNIADLAIYGGFALAALSIARWMWV